MGLETASYSTIASLAAGGIAAPIFAHQLSLTAPVSTVHVQMAKVVAEHAEPGILLT
jgi:hypothetical protein